MITCPDCGTHDAPYFWKDAFVAPPRFTLDKRGKPKLDTTRDNPLVPDTLSICTGCSAEYTLREFGVSFS